MELKKPRFNFPERPAIVITQKLFAFDETLTLGLKEFSLRRHPTGFSFLNAIYSKERALPYARALPCLTFWLRGFS